jgi:hypothetical protein
MGHNFYFLAIFKETMEVKMSSRIVKQFTTDDYVKIFLDRIHLCDNTSDITILNREKDTIDKIFFESIQKVKSVQKINSLFENYLFFYEEYQQYVSQNLALYFLNGVHSDINQMSENSIKMQKRNIDDIFCERIRDIKTIDEINDLFQDYITFFITHLKFVTEDFATVFLNKTHSDEKPISKSLVKTIKDEIDSIFFDKVQKSRSVDELNNLFENYLAFFDIYQEYIEE